VFVEEADIPVVGMEVFVDQVFHNVIRWELNDVKAPGLVMAGSITSIPRDERRLGKLPSSFIPEDCPGELDAGRGSTESSIF